MRTLLTLALFAFALPAFAVGPLNDTGIQFCGEALEGNNNPCTGTEPAGQDAHYGRDAAAKAGTLSKIGGGNAGFDFTKIANNGSVLPASATLGSGPTDWACTRDNVTGRIWEVKVNDSGHLRHQNHTYTWYDTNSPDGIPGNTGSTTTCGNTLDGQNCNTQNYAAAVRASGLCGYSDWRMPTRKELALIVDYGRYGPAIDPTYFPNTPNSHFWSGSPYADDLGYAWGVDFNDGFANGLDRIFGYEAFLVRLVRGGQ